MPDLEAELKEDLMLRNAAKRLVKADLGFVKGDVAQKGIGSRAAGRAREGAADIAENAADYADTHRVQVGTGIAVAVAAFAGWIFRDRLADAIYGLFHEKGPLEKAADKAEQLAEDARSLID